MITLEQLDIACANYKLTDLLKEISDENLVNLMRNISTNDVLDDIRVKEYEALLTEIEYRRNDQLVGSKTR